MRIKGVTAVSSIEYRIQARMKYVLQNVNRKYDASVWSFWIQGDVHASLSLRIIKKTIYTADEVMLKTKPFVNK